MDTPRILVVPGGTQVGAAAMAYASLHKLIELHDEHSSPSAPPDLPPHAPARTVVVMRDPSQVARSTLRDAAASPSSAFPELDPSVSSDPHLLDGIDLVVPTSGSTSGVPRLVGLSTRAMIASATATHRALSGPGRWILALPAHHIAGAQVLFRAALAGTSPHIVDTSRGFDPFALLPAIAGATHDADTPAYLSLVPTQLRACLAAGPDVSSALGRLSAVLVGGSGADPALMNAAHSLGIRVTTTYGMTETAGGCVYDGLPLPGVLVRTVDVESRTRLAIAGPVLMTRYVGAPSPFIDEGGARWLLTGDLGRVGANGLVEVLGRSDEVIVSGGLSIAPAPVRRAVQSTPGVEEAWIIGLPDAKWGSAVTAVIVPEPGEGVDVSASDSAQAAGASAALATLAMRIRNHVGEVLGRAQAPRIVVALDELPMLDSGKVDRLALRTAVAQRIGTGAEWRR